jgi:3-methylcrotonyl-CoA carboxylase alpha subunit
VRRTSLPDFAFTEVTSDLGGHGAGLSDGAILSSMPGHILAVAVAEDDGVAKGNALIALEAMKMEMALTARLTAKE